MFYGRRLGMSKREVLVTPVGEMRDMIACMSIESGDAKPKKKKKKRIKDFEAAMKLR